MKRFLFFAVLILGFSFSNPLDSNPIVVLPPQAFISELVFNPSHNWTLELEMFIDQNMPVTGVIDSIVLQSNSCRARLTSFQPGYYLLFTITAANLNAPFTINYLQDTLRVITYANPVQYVFGPPVNTHMLVFGYATCEIPYLLDGQSICAREKEHGNPRYFYLDNSPTPGVENDTTGAITHLTGRLYDTRDCLVSYTLSQYNFSLTVNVDPCTWGAYPPVTFHCPLDVFTFDQQGNYSTTLLSRNGGADNIRYLYWGYAPLGYCISQPLPCENISFFLEPGGTKIQDIHLTDSSFLVGIKDQQGKYKQEISIVCAPNPVLQSGAFFITADEPVEHAEIVIYSATGSVLLKLPVPQLNKSTVTFTRDQLGAPGLCFYTLLQNNKPVKSGEIICQ